MRTRGTLTCVNLTVVAWAGKRALGMSAIVCAPVAVLLAGCGPSLDAGGDTPPPKPSREQVARLVARTTAPIYWFGPRFGRYELSEINTRGPAHVGFSYGRFTCQPGSGCNAPGAVATRRRDVVGFGLDNRDLEDGGHSTHCWRKLGSAVFLLYGCDPKGFPQEAEV